MKVWQQSHRLSTTFQSYVNYYFLRPTGPLFHYIAPNNFKKESYFTIPSENIFSL